MKIAVIISGLVFDSQKALMKGVERQVRDLSDVCSVFCIHGNVKSENEAYADGESMIFRLPDVSAFDGVIYVKNTFSGSGEESPFIDKVRELNIPCVCIGSYDPDFVNITSDEKGSLYALTEHMIKEHDCKRFYYVSGRLNGSDAVLRFDGFMDALKDNGLSFDKDVHRYKGNYEYKSGVSAVDYFRSLDEPMADCIVCANDQMAVGVYMELKKQGFKVPKDVKITGVDYDFVSRVISTRLTTIKRQQYQKGMRAVKILHEFEKHKAGEEIVLPIMLSLGQTCGCNAGEENHDDVDDALAVDRYEQTELSQYVKKMTVSLMSQQKTGPLIDAMRKFAYQMKPKELYLCMNMRPSVNIDYSDFQRQILAGSNESEYADTMINQISCINGEPARTGDRFPKKDLFPPVANGGREGVTYYFFPIHYMNENFGYAILGESGDLIRNDFFPNWTAVVSNAFENTRKIDLMEQMISVLDRMWIYDTLTGIYNRAGFFKLSEPIVEESIKKNKKLCVIFLDVDGLKSVNDSFGHDAGDALIKDVANVLKNVKQHGEIVMRYGGDEFVLLASDYNEEDAEACIAKIEKEMDSLNERTDCPYSVEASVGYKITNISGKDELNAVIEDADKEMYKKKYVKKALKRK